MDRLKLNLGKVLELGAKKIKLVPGLLASLSKQKTKWRNIIGEQSRSSRTGHMSEKRRFMYQFTMASLGLLMVSSISTNGAFFETGGAVSHAGYFVNPDDLKLSFEELVANQDDGFLIGLGSSTQNSLSQNAIRTSDTEHVVKPGEDLSSIASWYGLRNVETIMWANNLDNAVINPGMRLAVPAADGLRYGVKSGETMEAIAAKFQVAAADIATFNNISNGQISEGQKLFIPNAVVTSTTLLADSAPVQVQPEASNLVASPTIDLPILQETGPTVNATPAPTGVGISDPAQVPAQTVQPQATPTIQVPDSAAPVVNAVPAPEVAPIVNATPVTQISAPAAAPEKRVTAGGWIHPTPEGCRRTQGYHGGHRAIDCAKKSGGPILAVKQGIVETSTCGRNGYGCYVIINHQDGYKSLYAHFNAQPSVSVGQNVTAGQYLGNMGTTGWSTGVHLHFELVHNGVKINPIGPIF